MARANLADWVDVIACPRCARGLWVTPVELACTGCGAMYPRLGDVPCLVPDPALWGSLWMSRLSDYVEVTRARIAHLRAELEAPLLARTRARLERVIAAKQVEWAAIVKLFEAVAEAGFAGATPEAPSRPEALSGRLAVLAWYEHLFRDWSWGAAESAQLAAIVKGLVSRPIELLAIYGAGAGRLAYDVHETLAPGYTVALDLNPLPLLAAERLVQGEELELYEFPVAPMTDEHMVVRQTLRAPALAPPNLLYAVADALRPPLRAGSVDAILTPWFVDAIGQDLRVTAAEINRMLAPGGLWIQVGPLNFNQPLSETYLREELLEVAESAGFRILSARTERLPYFDSPYSGSYREEVNYCFAAEKCEEAAPRAAARTALPWVDDPSLPIPPSPELTRLGQTSAFTATALAMVDGQRSIAVVAAELAPHIGLAPQDLTQQLRAFFAKLTTP